MIKWRSGEVEKSLPSFLRRGLRGGSKVLNLLKNSVFISLGPFSPVGTVGTVYTEHCSL
jgi:hypothetical protein